MTRILRTVLFLLLACAMPALAEDISLLAKYGNKPKNETQLAADKKFLTESVKSAGSAEKAADILVTKGFEALHAADPQTAMRRFNQAWLLQPEKPEIAWGFGVASASLGRFEEGAGYLEDAAKKLPQNALLINDQGFLILQKAFRQSKSKEEAFAGIVKSKDYFLRAAQIMPQNDRAYANLAIVEFSLGNVPGAQQAIKEAKARGGKSLDPNLVRDVEAAAKKK